MIVIESFGGVAPKMVPQHLGERMAQTAQNVKFDRASLRPYKGITQVSTGLDASTKAIYKYNGSWISSTVYDTYVGTPIASDVYDRLYMTGPTVDPQVRSAGSTYLLGVPRPGAPSASASGSGSGAAFVDNVTVSYVITYVNGFGEEGPASDPSTSIDVTAGQWATVTMPGLPSGAYNLTHIRLYRSNTGTSGTEYQFHSQVAVGTPTVSDGMDASLLGEVLSTSDWFPPPNTDTGLWPDGPLQGITELPNGVLAGFTGNTVCFSYPYAPHAWPVAYQVAGVDRVVALSAVQQGLLVATTGKPYLIVGATPDAMVRVPIEANYSCAAKASMVDMGDYAIYASPEGLVMVQGNTATLVTEPFFTREQWQALSPSTMRAFVHEGRYVCFYGTTLAGTGFVYDPQGGEATFVFLTGQHVIAGRALLEENQLYLVYHTPSVWGTANIGTFDTGSSLTYTWRSRIYVEQKPTAYPVMRVDALQYPVTVTIQPGDYSPITMTVSSDAALLLPGGFRTREWDVQVSGVNEVWRVGLYADISEVA